QLPVIGQTDIGGPGETDDPDEAGTVERIERWWIQYGHHFPFCCISGTGAATNATPDRSRASWGSTPT
ncbi:MAG: hypothetical protein ACK4V6_01215, partial [Microthrixaceae bacterium]